MKISPRLKFLMDAGLLIGSVMYVGIVTYVLITGKSSSATINSLTATAIFTPRNMLTNAESTKATFTPSPTAFPDLIFSDDFESGDLSAWADSSTNDGGLSVSSESALFGSYGMQVVISEATQMYVIYDSLIADARYHARFYFDPNSISMADGDYVYILQGYDANTNTIILRIEIKKIRGDYQTRLRVLDNSSTWENTPYTILTDAPHRFELDWLAGSGVGANDGQATFWVDGVQQVKLSDIANDSYRMKSVRLGLPFMGTTTMSGTIYFDAFESRRKTFIGP